MARPFAVPRRALAWSLVCWCGGWGIGAVSADPAPPSVAAAPPAPTAISTAPTPVAPISTATPPVAAPAPPVASRAPPAPAAPSVAICPAANGSTPSLAWPLALTFDDGPDPAVTPQVLAILDRHHAHATFFVVGEMAAAHPELVQAEQRAGDAIGDHTWSHPFLTRISEAQIADQIARTQAELEKIGGTRPTLFRAPYGAVPSTIAVDLTRQGVFNLVGWTADDEDYRNSSAAALESRVLREAAPGGVVLMHDIHKNMLGALDTELTCLEARGAYFVTVPEMIRLEAAGAAPIAMMRVPHEDVPVIDDLTHRPSSRAPDSVPPTEWASARPDHACPEQGPVAEVVAPHHPSAARVLVHRNRSHVLARHREGRAAART